MQNERARWLWVLGLVLLVGVGGWLFSPSPSPPVGGPVSSVAAAVPQRVPPADAPPAAPAIQHPIAPEAAADAAIPRLEDSDSAAWSSLSALLGEEGAPASLLRDHLIQRLVTWVDNLPQRSVDARVLPYRPLETPLALRRDAAGEATLDGEANGRRYAPFVRAFTRVDADALAAVYRRFYPLFQQAYTELDGRPRYFNDRLVAVIDHLLQAPVPDDPPAVRADERGRLRFTDPALESLSVGQKALLRLAPEQAMAVKQQLRAIRAAIARP